MADSDCSDGCQCVKMVCECTRGDGFAGDGGHTGDGEDGGKIAAIVGGTVGGVAGLALILLALGLLLVRMMQAGTAPASAATATAMQTLTDTNINPLHQPMMQEGHLNPFYEEGQGV